jgi:hypothetical protein
MHVKGGASVSDKGEYYQDETFTALARATHLQYSLALPPFHAHLLTNTRIDAVHFPLMLAYSLVHSIARLPFEPMDR